MGGIDYLINEFDKLKGKPNELKALKSLIEGISHFRDRRVSRRLIELLDHQSPEIVELAALKLGDLRCQEAVPKFKKLLYSNNLRFMNNSLRALRTLGACDIVDTLLPFFRQGTEHFSRICNFITQPDHFIRCDCLTFIREAVDILAQKKTPETVALLEDLAANRFYSNVLENIIKSLGEIAKTEEPVRPQIASCLIQVIESLLNNPQKSDYVFSCLQSAVNALVIADDTRAVPILVHLLRHADPNIVKSTVSALGQSNNNPIIAQELIRLLKHTDINVVSEVFSALGKMRLASTLQNIRQSLFDLTAGIREENPADMNESELELLVDYTDPYLECMCTGAQALIDIQGQDAVPTLIELIVRSASQVAERLIPILASTGSLAAAEFFVQEIENPESRYRKAVIKALSNKSIRRADSRLLQRISPTLMELLNSDDPSISTEASETLASLCDLLQPEVLNMLLANTNFKHMLLAAETLGKARNPKAFEIIEEKLQERLSKRESVSQIVSALDKLGGPIACDILIRLFNREDIRDKGDIVQALSRNGSEAAINLLVGLFERPEFCRNAVSSIRNLFSCSTPWIKSPEAHKRSVGFIYGKIGARLPGMSPARETGYQLPPDIVAEMIFPHLPLSDLQSQALVNRSTFNLVKQHLMLRGVQSRVSEERESMT